VANCMWLNTKLPTLGDRIEKKKLVGVLNFKVYFLESIVINFLVLSDVVRN
jgi:hypothetical protein